MSEIAQRQRSMARVSRSAMHPAKWLRRSRTAGVSHRSATSPTPPLSAVWIRSDSHRVIL